MKSHSASLLIFPFPSPPSPPQQGNKGVPQARGEGTPGPPRGPHRSGRGRRARLPSPRRRGWARPLSPHPGRAAWTPAGSHGTVTAPSPAAPPRPRSKMAASPLRPRLLLSRAERSPPVRRCTEVKKSTPTRGAPTGPRGLGRARPAHGTPAQPGGGRAQRCWGGAGQRGRAEGHGEGRITHLKGHQQRLIRFEKTAQILPPSDWPALPSR